MAGEYGLATDIQGLSADLPDSGGVSSWIDLTDKPLIGGKELRVGDNSIGYLGLVGDSDYRLSNARPASDVYSWAKQPTKPSYTASEVGALGLMDRAKISEKTLNIETIYTESSPINLGGGFYRVGEKDYVGEFPYSIMIVSNFDNMYTGAAISIDSAYRGMRFTGISEGVITGWKQVLDDTNFHQYALPLNGNAASATKLQTPRTIFGQPFNGTENVSGNAIVSSIQIGSNSDLGWFNYQGRLTAGIGAAQGVNMGSLLVSNMYSDIDKVPTYGIYVKGSVISSKGIFSTLVLPTQTPTLLAGEYGLATDIQGIASEMPNIGDIINGKLTITTSSNVADISAYGLKIVQGWDSGTKAYDSVLISANDVATLRLVESDGTMLGMCAGNQYATFATSKSFRFYVGSDLNSAIHSGANGTKIFSITSSGVDIVGAITSGNITSSGNITAKGSITPNYSSDMRLKENIQIITPKKSLEIIGKLSNIAIEYDWNNLAKSLNPYFVTKPHSASFNAQLYEGILGWDTMADNNGYLMIGQTLLPYTIVALSDHEKRLQKLEKILENGSNKRSI